MYEGVDELELVGGGSYRLLGHAYHHTLFCIQELLPSAGNMTASRLQIKVRLCYLNKMKQELGLATGRV
jgi:hypothetical protein